MQFRRLPLDLLQEIAHFLQLEDCVALYATFDRSLQKAFSTPGFFRQLTIPTELRAQSWDVHYFLQAVHNVTQLKLKIGVVFGPGDLPLILSLNPVEFTLPVSLLTPRCDLMMEKYADGSAKKSERHLARFMTRMLLPKFSRLTPRLERLHLVNTSRQLPYLMDPRKWTQSSQDTPLNPHQDPASFYRFPDSLTALNVDNVPEYAAKYMLDALPKTLRSLHYTNIPFGADIASFVAQFPLLEDLQVTRLTNLWWNTDVASSFPTSLTRFSFCSTDSKAFSRFCEDSHFNRSQVTVFEVNFIKATVAKALDPNLDLRALLPPTITDATIAISAIPYGKLESFVITSLPQSLTSLTLQIYLPSAPLFAAIMALQSLKTLNLVRASKKSSGYYIAATAETEVSKKKPRRVLRIGSSADSDASDLSASSSFSSTASSSSSSYASNGRNLRNKPEKTQRIVFALLPRSLTHLKIEQCSTTSIEAMVQDLPLGLIFLSLPYIDFSEIPVLRQHLPRCFLEISAPINLWKSGIGAVLLHRDFGWHRSVDLLEWATAVSRHFSALHVRMQLDWDYETNATPVLTTKSVKRLIVNSSLPTGVGLLSLRLDRWHSYDLLLLTCPKLEKLVLNLPPCSSGSRMVRLDNFPSTLTYFESDDPKLNIAISYTSYVFNLPQSLTYVSTQSICELPKQTAQLKSLTHLDAPHWRLNAAALETWNFEIFEKLSIHICKVLDSNILPFLTSEPIARDRSKFNLSISYLTTGLLLSTKGPDAVQSVTWDGMKLLTQQSLASSLFDIIGNISDITPEPTPMDTQMIFLPASALTATLSIRDPGGWILASELSKVKSKALLLPADDSKDVLKQTYRFPPKITYLELQRVQVTRNWLSTLPSSLTYLDIGLDEDMSILGSSFPSKLQVFILSSTRMTNLPFLLSQLPSTLKHLLIAAPAFGLNLQEDAFKTSTLSLPRLKSVRLFDPTLVTAWLFCNRLPLKTLENFQITPSDASQHTDHEIRTRLEGRNTPHGLYTAIRKTPKLIWTTNNNYMPIDSLVAVARHEIKKDL